MKKLRVRGIIPYQGGILVIKREREINNNKVEYYVFPGGGVENGESLEEAMKRELQEELGIKVSVKNQLYTDIYKEETNIYFMCEYESGEIGTGNGPEFNSEEYKDRGKYIPTVLYKDDLLKLNLVPESIKMSLYNDACKFGDFTKIK